MMNGMMKDLSPNVPTGHAGPIVAIPFGGFGAARLAPRFRWLKKKVLPFNVIKKDIEYDTHSQSDADLV
jgi:hypothetical protein